MNAEFKKLAITNRIARLRSRNRENHGVIKKLERQLRALNN